MSGDGAEGKTLLYDEAEGVLTCTCGGMAFLWLTDMDLKCAGCERKWCVIHGVTVPCEPCVKEKKE